MSQTSDSNNGPRSSGQGTGHCQFLKASTTSRRLQKGGPDGLDPGVRTMRWTMAQRYLSELIASGQKAWSPGSRINTPIPILRVASIQSVLL